MKNSSIHGDHVARSALVVIAVVAVFAVLKIGEDIFAPMVLATVGGVMLAPLTDWLGRRGLNSGLAASLVLMAGMVLLGLVIILVEPVIWRVAEALPRIKSEMREVVDEVRAVIRGLDEVNREVEEALGTEGGAASSEEDGERVMPNLTDALLFAPVFIAQFFIFLGTLFFFLLTRRGIYIWVSRRVGSSSDTFTIMRRFTTAEKLVSRYFLTITMINFGLGAALGSAMILIGLPAPIIWGLLAATLNFILYLGPIAMAVGLFIAGLVTFDGLMVMAPPVIYLCLNMIEAQFVTPSLVGRHISVNPLLIFVSLVFWLWLWGPIGAFIAIPVLAIALVMLDVFEKDARRNAPAPAAPVAPSVEAH